MARAVFEREPNILTVKRPVTIVADIHGQFYDLLTILAAGGDPAKTRYLFLGDYVDRKHSTMHVCMVESHQTFTHWQVLKISENQHLSVVHIEHTVTLLFYLTTKTVLNSANDF
ncbi:unnamed protein product [Adineta ricciae]|uniref:Calcineurin-like phosphoesterase domain-containing protein n=1 Tax=Adineta ricciae TaxID=249248 RepID=A0A815WK79_ADIRI|nr:unnamed protein product [Adineta ricciae]